MNKVIEWKKVAEKARRLSKAELCFAINDCVECVKAGVDGGYYSDEASVYRAELSKRNGGAK